MGERQISDKKYISSQISDKCYSRQISDRKRETQQFSDTHRKGENKVKNQQPLNQGQGQNPKKQKKTLGHSLKRPNWAP